MLSKWRLFLRELIEKTWFVALLYAVLAVATNAAAVFIGPLLPDELGKFLGAGAVEAVLTILTSSMLTVVTFSLGIMVSAFASAATSVTPRVTALLQTDRTTQRVLATFLGSFLYGLIGIISLNSGYLTDNDRLVLFIGTILVIVVVVIAILRWIAHLNFFGRVIDSISKVETATCKALATRINAPYLGGHGHAGPPPPLARPVYATKIGYVRYVHMDWLQDVASGNGVQIYLAALPGAFVHPGHILAHVLGPRPTDTGPYIAAFTIGETRDFDQDPRFGFAVLAEVAQRALSAAVNDPGTAIDILGRAVRLMAPLADIMETRLEFANLWVPALVLDDIMDDLFPPIARDGAGIFAVQIRLQKALLALTQIDPVHFGKSAAAQSRLAQTRSTAALMPHEAEAIADVVAQITQLAEHPQPRPL
jgi:uncharacterized membrane protein